MVNPASNLDEISKPQVEADPRLRDDVAQGLSNELKGQGNEESRA